MNTTHVIKLGGSLLDDASRRQQALAGIAGAWQRGEKLVLVHGGGKHVDTLLARLGIEKRTHAGLRITDAETLDVVVAVLAGIVNKSLVAELTAMGVRAAGISGADDSTLVAEPHPAIEGVELGHVGRVTAANDALIETMLTSGILPVVSSIALGPAGTLLNVNADSAASALATAVGAQSLRFITDVAGVLDGDGKLIESLTASEVEQMLGSTAVKGGMKPKLEAALAAMHGGVPAITIGEGADATQLINGDHDRNPRGTAKRTEKGARNVAA
ncbi:MAG: acetylglutamate kinase [Acidobacteriota bacterium]